MNKTLNVLFFAKWQKKVIQNEYSIYGFSHVWADLFGFNARVITMGFGGIFVRLKGVNMSPEKHAEFIGNFASKYAQAKSNRIGVELKLKTAKAILMQQAFANGVTQVAAQERDALANPDYTLLIDDLMLAVKEEETLKYQLQASDLQIQIWRTREASERLAIRSHE